MNKIKKQHYVPRFYLSNFTNDKDIIFVFDIQTQKEFGTSTENVAHKKFFYDYPPIDELGQEQIIEKTLSNFEGKSAKIINKTIELLEKGELKELTIDDKNTLAEYIIIQQLRTIECRVRGKHTAIEIERQLEEKGATEEFLKEKGLEAKNYNSKEQQIHMLLSPELDKSIEELTDRIWVFWDNKTKHKLYTSDNPVAGHIHQNINLLAYEIYFPLTPRFGISILLRKEFPEWTKNDNTIVSLSDTENVEFYNSLILTNSHRQIFSCEADFRLAKKIIQRTPNLSNPDRPRISKM